MSRSRLRTDQILCGVPLPFDTFDQGGNLLLRRGFVIESEAQLLRLMERGLFSEGAGGFSGDQDSHRSRAPGAVSGGPASYKGKKISVFGLIGQVHEELEAALGEPSGESFSERIMEIAALLRRAVALDQDAALATILLHHRGRYSIRRPVQAAIISELILERIGTPSETRARAIAAALTMNIAIMDLQDQLFAEAVPPNAEQHEIIRQHPAACVAHLKRLGVSDPLWLDGVLHHHETIDGKGYPAGLLKEQIETSAQVISLADRYASLLSGRADQPPMLPCFALREIFALQNKGIAGELIAPLVKELGIYPPGSVVVLANGDIGVVVKRTLNAHQPVVRIVKNSMNQRTPGAPKRLTKDSNFAVQKAIPVERLGFVLEPAALWEEAFEFDRTPA
jgi:HD-GYP domain-containing protein (c-di-GMP phosphodiesterase class II)